MIATSITMSQYESHHKAARAIVSDVHAYNYPTGRQRMNDSGACLTAEAIFVVPDVHADNYPTVRQELMIVEHASQRSSKYVWLWNALDAYNSCEFLWLGKSAST